MLQPKSRFDAPGSTPLSVNCVEVIVSTHQSAIGLVGFSAQVILIWPTVGV